MPNYYVAMCDVLGFKRLVENTPLPDLLAKYESLLHCAHRDAEHTLHSIDTAVGYRAQPLTVPHAVFSDTILLWVDASNEPSGISSVTTFFETIAYLIADAASLGLPVRAGVAYGEAYIDADRDTFIGQAIVDAHVAEASQDWVGGACDDSCMRGPHYAAVLKLGLVVPYAVPTKIGVSKTPQHAIEWAGYSDIHLDKWLAASEANADPLDKAKYSNALAFWTSIKSAL